MSSKMVEADSGPLVLPFRERKDFIRFILEHIIVLYLQIFNFLSPGFIKIFLNVAQFSLDILIKFTDI